MTRLLLHCDDRLGLTQEVLTCVVALGINLRGIELAEQQLFLKLSECEATQLSLLSSNLQQISGIHRIESVELLPGEREHLELLTFGLG